MITFALAFVLSAFSIYLNSAPQVPPVFIHNKRVESPAGTKVKLHNYKPRSIDVSYTPQQIVTVKNGPTRLPLSRNTYSTGMQHLKCILKTEAPQKKADRATLELLVRKEPLGKTMTGLLNKDTLLKSHQAVVRLYERVVAKNNTSDLCRWKPVLTLPETPSAYKVLDSLKVSPEGKILLENS